MLKSTYTDLIKVQINLGFQKKIHFSLKFNLLLIKKNFKKQSKLDVWIYPVYRRKQILFFRLDIITNINYYL